MKFCEKVRALLKGVRFRSPRRAPVVIFDKSDHEIPAMTFLKGLDYEVLASRYEEFCCTPAILRRMFKFRRHARGWRIGYFYDVYLMAMLDYISPRVVVTFTDNSIAFQELTKLMPRMRFYAIQNGVRAPVNVESRDKMPHAQLPPAPLPGSKIHMQNFVSWGPWDVELYNSYGHDVRNFITAGPVLAGYFKTEIADPMATPVEYEICLASQWRAVFFEENSSMAFYREAIDLLHGHLARYLRENPVTFCVARCSNDPREAEYFKRFFGENVPMNTFDRLGLSTYGLMAKSNVSLAVLSTAVWEAFAWGKKALICRYIDNPGYYAKYTPPIVEGRSYEEFARKLDELRRSPQTEYLRATERARRKLFDLDAPRPAHLELRERILKEIR